MYYQWWVGYQVFKSDTASPPQGWFSVNFLLWLLSVILVIGGIIALTRRQLLYGILLIIVGLMVGPGGTSIFN